ncbi:sensor histidine kinase [Pontibacillus salicampi]|uniref:histidine kinase n=1 Tax=Pontibacillus salicampi TaxID=1449801 RepID=A0ABV6LLQ6_9BACI
MKIRTKLMIFFLTIIFLMNGVAYYLYHTSQETIQQYDSMLERFFLLNEVEQSTNMVFRNMNSYMINTSPDVKKDYEQGREELQELEDQVTTRLDANRLDVSNYANMMESFLSETDGAMKAYQNGQISTYSARTIESEKIMNYIQDSTLTLINKELSEYDTFYRSLVQRSKYIEKMAITIFVFSLLVSILFALWFSKGITRPIHHLSNAAREIAAGKFDGKKVEVKTSDELRLLTNTFNSMRENIRASILEIKQKSELQRLVKEMELKSLQSQVNPHFLFNTLNIISKTSYIENADRTGELIESVSSLLRYNLSRLDKPATLQEELDSVQEYVFIQQARFGKRFLFETKIEEGTEEIEIPVLTLQPLIENAFIHGIERREFGGVIKVESYHSDNCVVIAVADNGTGITEDKRTQIMNGEDGGRNVGSAGHTTGIGLVNVMRRLDLLYEESGLVDIHSIPEEGTTIRLTLPNKEAQGRRLYSS